MITRYKQMERPNLHKHISDGEGMWVLYDDHADELATLRDEVERLREENQSIRHSRESLRASRDSAKSRLAYMRKRKAALLAGLEEIMSKTTLEDAKFVAHVAVGGWSDEELLWRNRNTLQAYHSLSKEALK